MKKLLSLCLKLMLVVLALFVGTFTVYMFNLDMKLMAFAEPYIEKVYDLRKRDRRV